jgi:hypothetical protein
MHAQFVGKGWLSTYNVTQKSSQTTLHLYFKYFNSAYLWLWWCICFCRRPLRSQSFIQLRIHFYLFLVRQSISGTRPLFFHIHSPFHCSKLVTRVDLHLGPVKSIHHVSTGWKRRCSGPQIVVAGLLPHRHVLTIKYLAISSFSTCFISFFKW